MAEASAEITGTLARVMGVPQTASFVLLDRADYVALTGLGFSPRIAVVDIADDADPHVVADALGEALGQSHSVRILIDSTAEIQASPARHHSAAESTCGVILRTNSPPARASSTRSMTCVP